MKFELDLGGEWSSLSFERWFAFLQDGLQGEDDGLEKDFNKEVKGYINKVVSTLERISGSKVTVTSKSFSGEGDVEDFFDPLFWGDAFYEDNTEGMLEEAFNLCAPLGLYITLEGNVDEEDLRELESRFPNVEAEVTKEASASSNASRAICVEDAGSQLYVTYAVPDATHKRLFSDLSGIDEISSETFDINNTGKKVLVAIGDSFIENASIVRLDDRLSFTSESSNLNVPEADQFRFDAAPGSMVPRVKVVEIDINSPNSLYGTFYYCDNLESIIVHGSMDSRNYRQSNKFLQDSFIWRKSEMDQSDLPIVYSEHSKEDRAFGVFSTYNKQWEESLWTLYDCEWRPLSDF